MIRREELAAVRERDRERNPRCRWTYVAVDGTPSECGDALTVHEARGNTHEFVGPPDWYDRRFLLALVDELAAAIEQGRHRRDDLRFCNKADQCHIKAEGAALVIDDIESHLSDLGPDA